MVGLQLKNNLLREHSTHCDNKYNIGSGLQKGKLTTGGLPTGGLATSEMLKGGLSTRGLPTGGLSTGGLPTGGLLKGGMTSNRLLATSMNLDSGISNPFLTKTGSTKSSYLGSGSLTKSTLLTARRSLSKNSVRKKITNKRDSGNKWTTGSASLTTSVTSNLNTSSSMATSANRSVAQRLLRSTVHSGLTDTSGMDTSFGAVSYVDSPTTCLDDFRHQQSESSVDTTDSDVSSDCASEDAEYLDEWRRNEHETDNQTLAQAVPRFEIEDDGVGRSKMELVNLVSGAMLAQVDFTKDDANAYIHELNQKMWAVSWVDPEFVVKLALYARQSLNLRSVSNYMLAMACNINNSKTYVKAYYGKIVRLPTDMIEVADLWARQVRGIKSDAKRAPLPVVMRKSILEKFGEFDAFELAKHNKSKRPKNRKKKVIIGKDGKPRPVKPVSEEEQAKRLAKRGRTMQPKRAAKAKPLFNLKKIIRQVHIRKPAEIVMSIVGKRYPRDQTEFTRSGLLGSWDSSRAGKRMRLPIPETWETQISSRGNKPEVWQDLLDHKKLPYMAMLRNLRNIIQAGVQEKYHGMILKRLQDERQVINSRQFPLRFFSAYVVIDELRAAKIKIEAENAASQPIKVTKKLAGRRNKKEQKVKDQRQKKMIDKQKNKPVLYDDALLNRYQSALDSAVRTATKHNVPPIPGRAIVVVDALVDVQVGDFKSGTVRTVAEIGVLLGLMCCWSGEHCRLFVRHGGKLVEGKVIHSNTILKNMNTVIELATKYNPSVEKLDEDAFLREIEEDTLARKQLDNVVHLGSAPCSNHDSFDTQLRKHLKRHRAQVNDRLQYVHVDLTGGAHSSILAAKSNYENLNEVHLRGYSDQLLRFISERGNANLLEQIDTVGRKYGVQVVHPVIEDSRRESIRKDIANAIPSPHMYRHLTVKQIRVFISSTFTDMMTERNLILRQVFPAVHAHLQAKHATMQLIPIDLRWGIRADELKKTSTLRQCIDQVLKSDVLIGFIGHRVGYRPKREDLLSLADEYPQMVENGESGCALPSLINKPKRSRPYSVTEIEMRLFVHSRQNLHNRNWFLFVRDMDKSIVPQHHRHLVSEATSELKKAVKRFRDLPDKYSHLDPFVFTYSPVGYRGLDSDGYPRFEFDKTYNFASVVCEKLIEYAEFEQKAGNSEEYMETKSEYNPCNQQREILQTDAMLRQWAAVHNTLVVHQPIARQLVKTVSNCEHSLLIGEDLQSNSALIHLWITEMQARKNVQCLVVPCLLDAWAHPPQMQDVLTYLGQSLCNMLDREAPQQVSLAAWINLLEDVTRLGLYVVVALGDWTTHVHILNILLQQPLYYVASNGKQTCKFVVSVRPENVKSVPQPAKGIWTKVMVPPLTITDRRVVVAELLAQYGKSLDERTFTNHLNQLCLKRDATQLGYIRLACSYLLMFAKHDNLRDHIYSLASTREKLIESIVGHCMQEYGKANTCAVLAVLVFYQSYGQSITQADLYVCASLFRKAQKLDGRLMKKHGMTLLTRLVQTSSGSDGIDNVKFVALMNELSGNVLQCVADGIRLSDCCSVKLMLNVLNRYTTGAADRQALSKLMTMVVAAFNQTRCKSFGGTSYYVMASTLMLQLGEYSGLIDMLLSVRLLQHVFADGYGLHAANLCRRLANSPDASGRNLLMLEMAQFMINNDAFLRVYPSLYRQQLLEPTQTSVLQQWLKDDLVDVALTQGYIGTATCNTDTRCTRQVALAKTATCMAVSVKGNTAVGHNDGSVTVIRQNGDLDSLYLHSQSVTSCTFIDDLTLFACSADGMIRVAQLDAKTSTPTVQAHRHTVSAVKEYLWDSRGTMLTVAWDGHIRQWLYRNGTVKAELDIKTSSAINCLAIHERSALAITGHWDTNIRAHDIISNKCKAVWRGHETSVTAVTFNKDASQVVSGDLNGLIKVWSTAEGITLGTFSAHTQAVSSLVIHKEHVISTGRDSLIKVWNSELGRELLSMDSVYKDNRVRASACSLNYTCTHAAVTYTTNLLCCYKIDDLWNSQSSVAWQRALQDHCIQLMFVPSEHSRHLIMVHERSVKMVDYLDGGRDLGEFDLMDLGQVTRVSASADLMAIGFDTGSLAVYSLMGAQWRQQTVLQPVRIVRSAHDGALTDLSVHMDMGLHLATVGADTSLIIWKMSQLLKDDQNAPVREESQTVVRRAHSDTINCVAFSDSRPLVATGGSDCLVKLWNTSDGTAYSCISTHQTAVIKVDVKFSCIVSLSSDGVVCVSSANGSLVTSLRYRSTDVQLVLAASSIARSTSVQVNQTPEPEFNWADQIEDQPNKRATPPSQLHSLKSIVDRAAVITCTEDGQLNITNPFKSCLRQQYNAPGVIVSQAVQDNELQSLHAKHVQYLAHNIQKQTNVADQVVCLDWHHQGEVVVGFSNGTCAIYHDALTTELKQLDQLAKWSATDRGICVNSVKWMSLSDKKLPDVITLGDDGTLNIWYWDEKQCGMHERTSVVQIPQAHTLCVLDATERHFGIFGWSDPCQIRVSVDRHGIPTFSEAQPLITDIRESPHRCIYEPKCADEHVILSRHSTLIDQAKLSGIAKLSPIVPRRAVVFDKTKSKPGVGARKYVLMETDVTAACPLPELNAWHTENQSTIDRGRMYAFGTVDGSIHALQVFAGTGTMDRCVRPTTFKAHSGAVLYLGAWGMNCVYETNMQEDTGLVDQQVLISVGADRLVKLWDVTSVALSDQLKKSREKTTLQFKLIGCNQAQASIHAVIDHMIDEDDDQNQKVQVILGTSQGVQYLQVQATDCHHSLIDRKYEAVQNEVDEGIASENSDDDQDVGQDMGYLFG